MRFYFDTSSLRKKSKKIASYSQNRIYTSSLTMFELISGISLDDYDTRKITIKNIMDSNIFIDWDSYKMKMHKAFRIPFNDVEGKLIREMAECIADSQSFEEVMSKKIYISESEYFTLESFQSLDSDLSLAGIDESMKGISEWRQELTKNHRKDIDQELFGDETLCSYVSMLAEVQFINFFEDISQTKRPSAEYFKALEKYDKSLDKYFFCSQLHFSLSQLNGMQCAKNDTIDILHTLFMSRDDVIVSDDKLFKKLGEWCKCLVCYNSDEFFALGGHSQM
ncbi:hypothetical protein [Paenibacillus marinisediminis]